VVPLSTKNPGVAYLGRNQKLGIGRSLVQQHSPKAIIACDKDEGGRVGPLQGVVKTLADFSSTTQICNARR
jgi:hypothetical protein